MNKTKHTTFKLMPIILLSSALGACSTAAWYDGIQYSQRQECERMQGTAREECLERISNSSYEDYERQRKEVSESANK